MSCVMSTSNNFIVINNYTTNWNFFFKIGFFSFF